MKNGDYILVVAPKDFPGKKYRGRYCYEHHLVYWRNFNRLPNSDEIIHHINGIKTDNSIENLSLEKRAIHSSHHTSMRGMKFVKIKCPVCNNVFEIEKRKSYIIKHSYSTCCSLECAHKILHISKEDKLNMMKNCFIEEYKKVNNITDRTNG